MSATFYFNYISQPSRAVINLAHLIGADLKLEHIDLHKGEHKEPKYLAINPKGAVPCLVEGDFILSESASIMRYLCDTREAPQHLFPRDDLQKRAKVDGLITYSGATLRYAVCYDMIFKVVVPAMKKAGELPEEEQKAIVEKMHKCFDLLEETLEAEKDGFLTGAEISIADLQIFEELNTLCIVKPDALAKHERVKKWFDTITEMARVKELTEQAGKIMKEMFG